MFTLAGAILAATIVATPNAGPSAPPPLIVTMRDGTRLEVPVALPPRSQRFIVEFHEPPLARRSNGIATQSTRNTIERFRRDVANLRFGKTAAAVSIEHEYFRAFHGVSATLDDASLAAVRQLPYVKKVHEDVEVRAHANDVEHLTRIGAPRMWMEFGVRGDGITVAVLDTGIDYMHPALGGGFGAGFKVIGGRDFVADDNDPMDEHGHGTHVAGIVAGNTNEVRGVAPNAKLLAFRVLGASGSGDTSDILEAIEWTVDPNQDGDLSDRVDVANMSLGSAGDSDSPTSLAVDAATLAGVVFCLSSGNVAGEHTVGTPASSRLGITVGSSESNDLVAPYSSRGPANPDWSLKPEIVAPGTDIVSARLGGGAIAMTGTSMASPHVAGAAALLLQLNPDWTPADVKSALVGAAVQIPGQVMAQGGGRVDIPTAAMRGTTAAPAAITFGRHAARNAWTSTRTITVVNRGNAARTYSASASTPEGITITADPADFTLGPGASRDVVVHAEISAEAGATSLYMSHGGQVDFTSEDDLLRVPWVAVDAARISISHELLAVLLSSCNHDLGTTITLITAPVNLLLPSRRCELFAFSIPTVAHNGTTLIRKAIEVDGDLAVPFRLADAPHRTHLNGVDPNGRPISSVGFSLDAPYISTYNVQFPPDSKFNTLLHTTFTGEPLRTSEFSDDFTIRVSEMLADFPQRKLYAIHHAPMHGVHGSSTLSTLPSDLRHARVTIAPQPAGTTLHALFGYMTDGLFGWAGMSDSGPLEQGWSGDLYLTEESDDRSSWSAIGVHTAKMSDSILPVMKSPMFRLIEGEFVASDEEEPSSFAYRPGANKTFAVGEMPRHFTAITVKSGETGFQIGLGANGPAGESLETLSDGYAYELRNGAGALLQEGTASGPFVAADFGQLGPYRAKLRVQTGEAIELAFDTSRSDVSPPQLVSLRVVDGDGDIVSRVRNGEAATLRFAAFDSEEISSARASWRAGGGPWNALPLTSTTEGNAIVDLAPVTTAGEVELRIELEDASGNTSTSIFPYSFSSGQRRRAVGK